MVRGFALLVDYAIFPVCVVGSMFASWALLQRGVPNLLVTPIVVGAFAGLALVLERARPERVQPPKRDLPLTLEAAHFLLNFELGYGLALGVTWVLERAFRLVLPVLWPSGWPVALQLLLAVTLYEGSSYWQHRWMHERASLWPFHVLHHGGAHLDFTRGARFHFVDFGTAAFAAYLPLVLLGTPENVITLLAVLVSVLGLFQHGNIRQRTPRWLDLMVCTPAVHRRHHARSRREHDANYANTVMWFDLLFGTYGEPDPVGPSAIGLDSDPMPAGFWAQFLGPFRRRAGGPAEPAQAPGEGSQG